MKTLGKVFFLLSTLLLIYCSHKTEGAGYRDIAVDEAETIAPNQVPSTIETQDTTTVTSERKLTKTGTINFRTSDMAKTKTDITKAVSELKGYISNENTSQYDRRTENTLTIRVPAENFDALLQKIESGAEKVDMKNIDVQDVTQEYIDLDARVRTKKELETRYQELLKRANSVEEILKIEEQIGNIRTEIESAEGRLRYFSKQVAYSTLTVTYYEQNTQFDFFNKMGNALKSGWNNLLWVVVALTNLWAIILFAAIVIFVVTYLTKRRRRKV